VNANNLLHYVAKLLIQFEGIFNFLHPVVFHIKLSLKLRFTFLRPLTQLFTVSFLLKIHMLLPFSGRHQVSDILPPEDYRIRSSKLIVDFKIKTLDTENMILWVLKSKTQFY
jgi:hypothetical protein